MTAGGGHPDGPEVAHDDHRLKVDAAVECLVGLGATTVRANDDPDQHWVVMRDPEVDEPVSSARPGRCFVGSPATWRR